MSLEYTRVGSGPPLLLVHGVGSRREAWGPVLPLLAEHRDVIAVDLPGFGMTPLRRGQDITPAGLAHTLAQFCEDIGIPRPHVGGNSLGGWIALELGKLDHAASITALSPAGLWRTCPLYSRVQIRGMRDIPRAIGPGLGVLSHIAPLRMALSANVFGRPWRVPRQVLIDESVAMSRCEGYDHVLEAAKDLRFAGGMTIKVPVTIAFGRRDIMLGPGCRMREELPAHHEWSTPRGWGHMPTYDDPQGVADLLLAGSSVGRVDRAQQAASG